MVLRARQFRDFMKSRRTIRDFSDRPVPREAIEACIEAAATAPSGANHQPWHFAVIGSPDLKHRIREAAEKEERAFYAEKAGTEWLAALEPLGTDPEKPFLDIAPWLIAIFGQKKGGIENDGQQKNYYVTESVGIATGLLIAALHSAGLATLTHTPNPMGFLNEICGRPKSERAFVLLVVGYPAEGATVPKHALRKKPLSAISSWL
ncbi:MAG: nitroreductase family protein [Alphaproteobacteria bacterium]|nr:nitroreductase family protein [Alphaproteobacteria bacterium]